LKLTKTKPSTRNWPWSLLSAILTLTLVLALALVVVALPACKEDPLPNEVDQEAVAATVNGAIILENKVTRHIEAYRSSQSSMQTKESWAKALASANLTPVRLRENVISLFVDIELIRQDAAQRGIEPNQDTINNELAIARNANNTPEDWLARIAAAGFATEEEYRASLEDSHLRSALREQVAPPRSLGSDELRLAAASEAAQYAGKRSTYLLFRAADDQPEDNIMRLAQEAYAALQGGADFDDLLIAYNTSGGGDVVMGDAGWDRLNPTFDAAYFQTLAALAPGEYSAPSVTSFGVRIIYCERVFQPGEGGTVRFEDIPSEILDRITSNRIEQNRNAAFEAHLVQLRAAAALTVEPMPQGLPYAVDMDQYVTSKEEGPAEKAKPPLNHKTAPTPTR
jgi:foldase protein PrsA